MAKVLGLKQLLQKKYTFLEGLPEPIIRSFGKLTNNFVMIIWGMSGNGKSNFTMQFIIALMQFGKVLYVALEEGFEATTQLTAMRQLDEEAHSGKIEFADHEMKIEELKKKLKKKKSPRFIVIDSLQYWKITYDQYKELKEMFPNKTFIFISHAAGKLPRGKTAEDIMYDAGIKVRIEGYVCTTVISRYGGNMPYVIWEEGAKKYWGAKYKKTISGIETLDKLKPKPKKNEKTPLPEAKPLAEPRQLVLGEQPVQREGETVLPQLAQQSA
jgi:KaiC/GvpD/RAD55 family RecA-like ATPase